MDEKTFWEHLEELRRYIIWILVWFGVAFILGYQLAPKLLNVIAKDTRLYFFAPWEPFLPCTVTCGGMGSVVSYVTIYCVSGV